jgi:hypothetical protein
MSRNEEYPQTAAEPMNMSVHGFSASVKNYDED